MSVLAAVPMPAQSTSDAAAALQKLEEEKNKAQLVKTLAERYGGRAIQRTTSGEDDAASTSPTSSSFQPFSSTWAARYWQLQKAKAEQALAELEEREREKTRTNDQA